MKSKLLLISIVLLASILRLYKLGEIPRGLYIDEPSIGFNAYSILTTAQDQYGQFLPLSFQAFGEYKLPVYIYGTVPLLAIFGTSAFSVRLLSALAGITGTFGIYLLTKQILSTQKKSELIPTISALLFAISPWSIHFSRAAYEANLAVTLLIFAIYFFLRFVENQTKKSLIFSLILFVINLYTYNASRIIIPILILTLTVTYRKIIFKNRFNVISLSILLLLIIPSIFGSAIGLESSRLKGVIEFGNQQYLLGSFLGFIQKYLTHFSSEFLFFKGDILARHSTREVGELYLSQLPFILIGIFIFLRDKIKSPKIILFTLLLISPIPAAIATPVPHAVRSIFLIIPLTILTSIGINYTINKYSLKYITPAIISLIFIYSTWSYLHSYYIHYANKSSWDWNEQETLLAEYLTQQNPQSNRIIIESSPINIIYIKFFNASKSRETQTQNYIYTQNFQDIDLQNGDTIAISGWKGTPDNLKNTAELKMQNNSIGYKVGTYQK